MRVLHVTRDYPPRYRGGISRAVETLVTGLRAADVDSDILSIDGYRKNGKAKEQADSSPDSRLTEAAPNRVRVFRVSSEIETNKAIDWACDSRLSIVHCHTEFGWLATHRLRQRLGCPAVYTVHVAQAHQNQLRGIASTLSSRLQEQALREADVVHVPSARVLDVLSSPANASSVSPTVPLSNRIAVCPFAVPSGALRAERQREPRLLFAGRFVDLKGLVDLFDALPMVWEEVPDLRVTVAGGLPENPRAEALYRERWKSKNSSGKLEFAGWCEPAAVSAYMDRATLFVAPSWYETQGLAVAEAMVSGLPVVATQAGALADIVTEETAWPAPVRDPRGLASAILACLRSPQEAQKRALQARHKAASQFSLPVCSAAMLAIYRKALGG